MKRILLAAAFAFAVLTASFASAGSSRDLGYDPQADPFEQYHDAIALAKASDRLVLVIAGGDWCYWCHVLDRFVKRDADVKRGMEDTFVVVKVYVGDENYNELFFSQLPAARGAPHFWVISPDRNVLTSQSTGAFEQGRRGYDKVGFLGFIDHWKQRAAQGRLARSHSDTPERS